MRRTAALLLILFAATACRVSEPMKRAAASAVSSFVLQTVLDLQGRTPLTQSSRRPALQANGWIVAPPRTGGEPKGTLCSARRKRILLPTASRTATLSPSPLLGVIGPLPLIRLACTSERPAPLVEDDSFLSATSVL